MSSKPLNILLVDDDEINNFLSKELIDIYCPGTNITAKLYVPEALDLLKQGISKKTALPDVILVDINMPLVSGWDFIEGFEKLDQQSTDDIKLYIYTSSEYFEDINKAKTYRSVRDIFSKPLTTEMIRKICNKR
jgi:CheY-like chemotaxis protein